MSNASEQSFPPWLSDAIGAAVRLVAARRRIADANREDLVHQVWVYLLDEGSTPELVAATSRNELWPRLLTLANRGAASAARAKRRLPQVAALSEIHDGSASPAQAAELRDLIERIAEALRDFPIEKRRLVARKLARHADTEATRSLAAKCGLTEHDLLTGTKAMTAKNRQTLHRLSVRLRALITSLTLVVAAEASVARADEPINKSESAPVSCPKPVDRGHWN